MILSESIFWFFSWAAKRGLESWKVVYCWSGYHLIAAPEEPER